MECPKVPRDMTGEISGTLIRSITEEETATIRGENVTKRGLTGHKG